MHVVFFGDSICVGQRISPHKSWVHKISERLANEAEANCFEVVVSNASVNGDTTRLALERMPFCVQSHPCDLIVIQFGMNDCNLWKTDNGLPRVTPRAFEANLHEIADRAKACGARKIFIHTNQPTDKFVVMPPSNTRYQDNNRAYNEIIRNVASGRDDLIFTDIESQIETRLAELGQTPAYITLPDLIHLNEKGHELYFEITCPSISGAVMELAR